VNDCYIIHHTARGLHHSPLTKSRQGSTTRVQGGRSRTRHEQNPGPAPGGADPCTHSRESLVHRELRSARRGQFWHRRLTGPTGANKRRCSNLDTLLGRGFVRGCACC
jgi:hypothetical protein